MVDNHPVDGHRPRDCDRHIDVNPPSLAIFLWRVNIQGIVIFFRWMLRTHDPPWMMMMTAQGNGNSPRDVDHHRIQGS